MTPAELKDAIRTILQPRITKEKEAQAFDALIDYIGGNVGEDFPDWTSALVFQTDGSDDGRNCRHSDTSGNVRLWETKIDDNEDNEPPTDPEITEDSNWIEVSPGGNSVLKTVVVDLTADQVRSAYSFPVKLKSSPGAGKAFIPLYATLEFKRIGASFATNTDGFIQLGTAFHALAFAGAQIGSANSNISVAIAFGQNADTAYYEDQDMYFQVDGGNPTGGGTSTVRIRVTYYEITLN